MEVNSLLTSEEIFVIRSAPSRYADWLVHFVRENANNSESLEDERILIIETMKTWWINRNWKSLFPVMEVKTDFLKKDEAVNLYIDDLLSAQEKRDTKFMAHVYFEFANDQYHDGEESFYRQMGLDRMDETWKLFREAVNLDPTNVEIRSRFIGLMHQGGGGKTIRGDILNQIGELLEIPIKEATTFGKTNLESFYNYPKELLQKFLETGNLLLHDEFAKEFEGFSDSAMKSKGSASNELLTYLVTDYPIIDISTSENKKTAKEYYLESIKFHGSGNIKDEILSLRKSIALELKFPEAHFLLGIISLKLLLIPKAIEEFITAIDLQPEIAKYHYYLGEAYLANRNNQKALVEFGKTLDTNPFFEEARTRISEIKLKASSEVRDGEQDE